MLFSTYTFTDAGGRSPNEDSVGYFEKDQFKAWIAADGLGGHESGEIASGEAVESFGKALDNCSSLDEEFVKKTFQTMNDAIIALHGPLTTAVCAFSDGEKLWYGNNGDSRFFFIRDKKVLYHSNDHSIAYIAYLSGSISYEDIPSHPAQNRLYHSLGNEDNFYGEFFPPINLEPGDAFLLATDGFWELITDAEIIRSLTVSSGPKEWMMTMIDIIQSRLRDNSDNYSAVCAIIA